MRPAGIGGIRKPKFLIPGGDLAGTVAQLGGRVTGFTPGDHVYGHGAFAEFVAVPQGNLAHKPANLTFEQAAAVPLGAITAIQGLRAGGLKAGRHVLVIGASGGVGTFAVQIAKHLGAEVTGVCSVDLVRRLGADHVIDYTTRDIHRSRSIRPGLPARRDLCPGSHPQGAHRQGHADPVVRGRQPLGRAHLQHYQCRATQPLRRPDPKELHSQGDDRSPRRDH